MPCELKYLLWQRLNKPIFAFQAQAVIKIQIFSLLITMSLGLAFKANAQVANDNCSTAVNLPSVINFCSNTAEFSNINAKAEPGLPPLANWPSSGKDIWYKFTATKLDISMTISGASSGQGTLQAPLIALYKVTDCKFFSDMNGSVIKEHDVTTYYKGGLTIGQQYYIRISAENNNTGTFKLCISNFNPILRAGQDCATTSYLCSKESFNQTGVVGAGLNNRESAGTCIDKFANGGTIEANTAWYKWSAANNGTLSFTISPTQNDDIDWVLYDLGLVDDCSLINSAHAIRCAAGSGTNCLVKYKDTGLNFSSTDLTESSGCALGQDGFVKYIDMAQGHYYALLINNFSNGNNGFNISFEGTGEFAGPKADILMAVNNVCTPQQEFVFSNSSTNFSNQKWSFGEGANIPFSTDAAPLIITYATSGIKTIVLEATAGNGCSVVSSKTIEVSLKPMPPSITVNKPLFCLLDTIKLSTEWVSGRTYSWEGPDNFMSDSNVVSIPIRAFQAAGIYSLVVSQNGCNSDRISITIPPILKNPISAFRTDPGLPAKLSYPVTIYFLNESVDASSYLWEFGDGETSQLLNPVHEYKTQGNYTVTLTTFKSDVCSNSISKGEFVIREGSALFIPNTFTPNGDNINDEFVVNLTNLAEYYIEIYNRWGRLVFKSADIFDNWKGNFDNTELPIGTYFYKLHSKNTNGTTFDKSGYITLLR